MSERIPDYQDPTDDCGYLSAYPLEGSRQITIQTLCFYSRIIVQRSSTRCQDALLGAASRNWIVFFSQRGGAGRIRSSRRLHSPCVRRAAARSRPRGQLTSTSAVSPTGALPRARTAWTPRSCKFCWATKSRTLAFSFFRRQSQTTALTGVNCTIVVSEIRLRGG